MSDEPVNDPIRRLMEWQDHRYDPGYFLGGRVHPILLAPRPNKFGYLLIISGSAYVLLFLMVSLRLLSLFQDWEWPAGTALFLLDCLLMWGWGALQLIAGFKLIQRPPGQDFLPEYDDESPGEPWWEATEPESLPAARPERPATGRKSRRPYARKTPKPL